MLYFTTILRYHTQQELSKLFCISQRVCRWTAHPINNTGALMETFSQSWFLTSCSWSMYLFPMASKATKIFMSAILTNTKPFTQIVIKLLKHFKSQEHGHLLEGAHWIRDVRRCRQRAIMKVSSTEVKNYEQSHGEWSRTEISCILLFN